MPNIQIPRKIMRVYNSPAMYKILTGGRASSKSGSAGRLMLLDCQTKGCDVLCGREYQNSIDDSVHKLLKGLINGDECGINGFNITDRRITCSTNGNYFAFRGFSRNPQNVKSAEDFKRCWMEEAQSASQATLDDLLPTIREEDSQIWFTMNPQSSEDPISKRFLIPYWDKLLEDGFYEDDMHCITTVNWRDNPFWNDDLEKKRMWDYENQPRAKYNWIWEGDFNDSVESPLVLPEWFDACIDAHIKLGFEPVGIKLASHDPSDLGPDSKGYAMRHGSVVLDVREKTDGDINEGGDWAANLALDARVDGFSWDIGGMGTGLKRQFADAFYGKHTTVSMFDGAKGVDRPTAIHEPIDVDGTIMIGQKTVEDCLVNRRAQYYCELRSRIYNTYRAVVHGEYKDPDTMISFSSKIKAITKLRSEVCRMPIKPNKNGKFELYTKEEMKNKFKFASPNLADPVMMLMRIPIKRITPTARRPRPRARATMGRRAHA